MKGDVLHEAGIGKPHIRLKDTHVNAQVLQRRDVLGVLPLRKFNVDRARRLFLRQRIGVRARWRHDQSMSAFALNCSSP